MEKVSLKPSTAVYPAPTAVISVGNMDDANLITLAWVGNLASDPPVVGISVRPSRHSYAYLEETGEFVVNLPNADQRHIVDFCGTRSGKNMNKWTQMQLTKLPGTKTKVPLLGEFPVNIECRVTNKVELGSHWLYLGEVLAVHVSKDCMDGKKVDVSKLKPLAYMPLDSKYYEIKDAPAGKFGESIVV